MKALEPAKPSGATYEDFLSELEKQKKVLQRKTQFLAAASYLGIFALILPREAWQGSELVGTLIIVVATLVAQYYAFRGSFERLSQRLIGKSYGLTLYALVLMGILGIHATYGLVRHLVSCP